MRKVFIAPDHGTRRHEYVASSSYDHYNLVLEEDFLQLVSRSSYEHDIRLSSYKVISVVWIARRDKIFSYIQILDYWISLVPS